jgi:uncharacterized membrane protein YkoI
MFRARFILALSVAVLLVPTAAMADEESDRNEDHRVSDRVYEGARTGKILPLVEILKQARGQITGEVIETKFEQKDGRPAYEIYFLDKKGRRKEIYVDARTGLVLNLAEGD